MDQQKRKPLWIHEQKIDIYGVNNERPAATGGGNYGVNKRRQNLWSQQKRSAPSGGNYGSAIMFLLIAYNKIEIMDSTINIVYYS